MSEPLDIEALKASLPGLRRMLPSLALELPRAVYDDVRDRLEPVIRALPSLLSAYEELREIHRKWPWIADSLVADRRRAALDKEDDR